MSRRVPKQNRGISSLNTIQGYSELKAVQDYAQDLAETISRRTVIRGFLFGFAGLTLACVGPGEDGPTDGESASPSPSPSPSETSTSAPTTVEDAPAHYLGIWLNINPQGEVRVIVVKNEMGQGISTATAQIVAEELDADWSTVSVDLKPELADYLIPFSWHATYGSLSLIETFDLMREAGAAARAMLLQAAAKIWGVPVSTLDAKKGVVSHPTYGQMGYGELAEVAATLPVPEWVELKEKSQFQIVGQAVERLDARAHVTGELTYAIDLELPNLLHGAIRHAPVFGGEAVDISEPRLEGAQIHSIETLPGAVAVLADSWWVAQRVSESLDIQWDNPPALEKLDSTKISETMHAALEANDSWVAESAGNADWALSQSTEVVDETFEVPFLAHATMEPINCVAWVRQGICEVWAPTQYALGIVNVAQALTGLARNAIIVHTMPMGGGFGRKAEADFVAQAITLSIASGRPVKLIWSRAEDIQHDYFRPPMVMRVQAGLDGRGKIFGWQVESAGPAIMDGQSEWNVWGLVDMPYAIPHRHITYAQTEFGIPIGWLRGVGFSKGLLATESMMDMLAERIGEDPLAFRRRHLQGESRMLAVVDALSHASAWGVGFTPGSSQGLCILKHFRTTYLGCCVELSVEDGRIDIHRVTLVIDAGLVVNPDILKAQLEGGVVFGLSTGLQSEVTLRRGAIVESNFHDYGLIGFKQCPHVETVIIESDEDPGGAGEYSVAAVPMAVLNAIARATGERIRALPFTHKGFRL